MNESAIAHEADLNARDAIALMADRISARGSFVRALLMYALDAARTGTPTSQLRFADALGIPQGTLTSRARSHDVDIKAIFDRVRLVRAAAMLERQDISVGMASLILSASSEQSFCRSISTQTGLTPTHWRATANSRTELLGLERYLVARLANLNAMPAPAGGRIEVLI